MVGATNGMSQFDIQELYINKTKGRGDERTFQKTIWPLLEGYRKKDNKVSQFDRILRGKAVPHW